MLQSSFSVAPSNTANPKQQPPQEGLQNLSAPSPASVTAYRDFSEDSTSIVSKDDTTLDEGSNGSSRMSATSVSTIKDDDTLVSSISIATPFAANGAPQTAAASGSKPPQIPLSFLGITKQHKQLVQAHQSSSSLNTNQIPSTTLELKQYKEEDANLNQDSALIEAMESHSALISTPTNEVTGNVYNFTPTQFVAGRLSEQGMVTNSLSQTSANIAGTNLICHQQQQRIFRFLKFGS